MKICIVGWYGTETLGDRAILAGILKILNSLEETFRVSIGSLYPFFTRRTIFEDGDIYREIAPHMQLDYFDVKNKSELDSVLAWSDLVVMGGGPIMDLVELEVVLYSFVKAKKMKKKTMLCGCGIGPLYKKQYIKMVSKILEFSDLAIFRDRKSFKTAKSLYTADHEKNFYYSHDPAILPVGDFLEKHNKVAANCIAVNFRSFPESSFRCNSVISITYLANLLKTIADKFEWLYLVPMHTFFIGGDDRAYLTQLALEAHCANVKVIHKPMNLYELFEVYANASACIGMRYHSIVFQTLLNGNNFIFDYTDRVSGKIISFLELIDDSGFYKDRYFNLQSEEAQFDEFDISNKVVSTLSGNERFSCDEQTICGDVLRYYSEQIKKIMQ
jgi:polysaccharide pyruvyl transferase WcaK-like protein